MVYETFLKRQTSCNQDSFVSIAKTLKLLKIYRLRKKCEYISNLSAIVLNMLPVKETGNKSKVNIMLRICVCQLYFFLESTFNHFMLLVYYDVCFS